MPRTSMYSEPWKTSLGKCVWFCIQLEFPKESEWSHWISPFRESIEMKQRISKFFEHFPLIIRFHKYTMSLCDSLWWKSFYTSLNLEKANYGWVVQSHLIAWLAWNLENRAHFSDPMMEIHSVHDPMCWVRGRDCRMVFFANDPITRLTLGAGQSNSVFWRWARRGTDFPPTQIRSRWTSKRNNIRAESDDERPDRAFSRTGALLKLIIGEHFEDSSVPFGQYDEVQIEILANESLRGYWRLRSRFESLHQHLSWCSWVRSGTKTGNTLPL